MKQTYDKSQVSLARNEFYYNLTIKQKYQVVRKLFVIIKRIIAIKQNIHLPLPSCNETNKLRKEVNHSAKACKQFKFLCYNRF